MLRIMLVDDEIWTLRDLEVLLSVYAVYEERRRFLHGLFEAFARSGCRASAGKHRSQYASNCGSSRI